MVLIIIVMLGCEESTQTYKPQLVPMTESVYASAQVIPMEQYTVHAAANGIIETKYIEEGDLIKKGNLLFQLSNERSEIGLDRANINYEFANSNVKGSATLLSELENEIKTAQLKLKQDSLNFVRQKRLWDQDIGSKSTFEQMELSFQLSQQQLATLENRYSRTKKELENQLKLANNQVASNAESKEDFVVRSKLDGRVFEVFKEIGEAVTVQEPLAIIGSANQFILELQVDEVDIAKIYLNQKVLVTLEAFQDQVFEAKISRIYPNMNTRSQTFRVEAIFNDPPKPLYPGLSAEANIILAEKEVTLVIPSDYLTNENQVLTENGSIEVTTGLRSMDKVEILSGIDTSTQLIKPD